jgi:hypothetical protein
MIKDFFSHKIHSSADDWPEKLIELAFIFSEFDGQVYERTLIEERLGKYSPRSMQVARDPSKFRDEYGAYPAYFGIYHLIPTKVGWVLVVSETAKRFLISEDPDVAAFLRVQLGLFQYPSAMGSVPGFGNGGCSIRLQANTRDRILGFINSGIHLSPLRLIIRTLHADSILRKATIYQSEVSFIELFTLANLPSINGVVNPSVKKVAEMLDRIRRGEIQSVTDFESRFHLLKHLDLFQLNRHSLKVRTPVDKADMISLRTHLSGLLEMNQQFGGFDAVSNETDLRRMMLDGSWQEYFDGVRTIPSATLEKITSQVFTASGHSSTKGKGKQLPIALPPMTYTLSGKVSPQVAAKKKSKWVPTKVTDHEAARIKRERRNIIHKILVEKMDHILKGLNGKSFENAHIDLYGEVPGKGSILFEMKSGGENLLAQVRKAVSQLYEYRYRYNKIIHTDSKLCLVLTTYPDSIPWVIDYLVKDRGILICWFDDDKVAFPEECEKELGFLNT